MLQLNIKASRNPPGIHAVECRNAPTDNENVTNPEALVRSFVRSLVRLFGRLLLSFDRAFVRSFILRSFCTPCTLYPVGSMMYNQMHWSQNSDRVLPSQLRVG